MIYHVLTLFPELIESYLQTSIMGRAAAAGQIECHAVNIRDYSKDKHKKVDDYPYGGGAGMVMQAQPVYDAWRSVIDTGADANGQNKPRCIYLSPQGRVFDQALAKELAQERELIFLCGHYEGVDERVLDEIVTDQISAGDYVLTGGELPALVMIDAISRLVPGVLGNKDSAAGESFEGGLLEYPQYSRPEVWHDIPVPEVLLSGDHEKIEAWRHEQSVVRTVNSRPDLMNQSNLSTDDLKRLLN